MGAFSPERRVVFSCFKTNNILSERGKEVGKVSETAWHCYPWAEAVNRLGTDAQEGLSFREAQKRLTKGLNKIEREKRGGFWHKLVGQFTDTMVLVLLAATVVSGLMGEITDAVTILAIVVVNGVLGFIQEYRAERSLDVIKKLSSPVATVVRGGKRQRIDAEKVVPGDIVVLETGDKVPADLRLIETFSLEVEESALTGESVPVSKAADVVLPDSIPLAEMMNRAFMGTIVTRGRGKGVVVATGMDTVMGQIAAIMKTSGREPTPLQVKLNQLGKILIVLCISVCLLVSVMGVIRGEPPLSMLMAGVSLAVAAIPEGLPAVVTVVLALGVQRMAKRNAVVRKLSAVETLGCTTIICSDKTGTLTQNQMTVKRIATWGQEIAVTGEGYSLAGGFIAGNRTVNPLSDYPMSMLVKCAYHCNHAEIDLQNREQVLYGDPTEGALLVMALKAGYKASRDVIREVPFDSARKLMSVIVAEEGRLKVYVKGALDVLLPRCSGLALPSGVSVLTDETKRRFLRLQEEWARQAYRVLAFAYKDLSHDEAIGSDEASLENNLVFLGIAGMVDPPRPQARASVSRCLRAGIIPVMITGDHPQTALAIAKSVGITDGEQVITGLDIDELTDRELVRCAETVRVFARVSPQHKFRIVRALKQAGHVVAMTGDGVNDAPAVKEADIGISMGINGTEITKEASSMVLADDNFSTIEAAVYEGRAIYDNIRKFVRYLLGCNVGEVLTMFFAAVLGMPLPLLPIQILWVNLVTDGLPAMALGVEPPEPGIMKRKPRPKNENLFAHGLGWAIMGRGIFISLTTLLVFTVGIIYGKLVGQADLSAARTMAFTYLVAAQLFYVIECRSERFSPFEIGFFGNKFLLVAILSSCVLQGLVIYCPGLQPVFDTVALEGWQWAVIISVAGFRLGYQALKACFSRKLLLYENYAKIRA